MSIMARRSASARPTEGSFRRASKGVVGKRAAASESIRKCETSSARACVEKASCQPRQCFRTRLLTGGCVAGRQDDPVGVELELRDLGRGQEPIVGLAAC